MAFSAILLVIYRPSVDDQPTKITEIVDIKPFDDRITVSVPQASKDSASKSKVIIKDALPIHIADFKTSTGIVTDIVITSTPYDPKHILRVSIIPINYSVEVNDYKTNPDVIAFKESFEKVKQELTTRGVDPKDFYYLFNSRDYEHEAAQLWIAKLKLL